MAKFLLLMMSLLITLLISACGFGRLATGVVVWSPDTAVAKNGDLVWVWEQSRIRKVSKIQLARGGDAFEMESWRMLTFSDESAAKTFAQTFQPLANTWAVSGKQGLPVRSAADANAARVYKLGEGEEVKLLSQSAQKIQQGNLEGHWVQVMTKDGYRGWVFDYYLSVVDHGAKPSEAVKASGPGDENIQKILTENWYPEEMKAMAEQDRINLDEFRTDLGLHSVANPPSFYLKLAHPEETFSLPIETPKKMDSATYYFGGPNKVSIQFTDPEYSRIALYFSWQNQTKITVLCLLPDGVGTLISRELASRQLKLKEILARGSLLQSPTYGTIALQPNGDFTWTGLEALQPPASNLFSADQPTNGSLHFDWFRDRRLYGEFRVVRFQFGNNAATGSQIFLYRFLKDGFQLLPVSQEDMDTAKQTVLRESHTGLSLFFTFQ